MCLLLLTLWLPIFSSLTKNTCDSIYTISVVQVSWWAITAKIFNQYLCVGKTFYCRKITLTRKLTFPSQFSVFPLLSHSLFFYSCSITLIHSFTMRLLSDSLTHILPLHLQKSALLCWKFLVHWLIIQAMCNFIMCVCMCKIPYNPKVS